MKHLTNILTVLATIFLIWVVASYFNTIFTNMDPDLATATWNFFSVCYGK